jgi:hypothetical protein
MTRPFDAEWLADALDTVQEMRSRHGEMDLLLPIVLLPHNQRALEHDLRDLRRFGYAFQIGRDAANRITRVRLLEH